jgi:PRTRC genetic system ThiF family protein
VVGCGGTGGFVADDLCRLLMRTDIPILLVDHDRVEPHNLRRQNFYAGDVGKFKSQALAERLSRNYGIPIGYSVFPFDIRLRSKATGGSMYSPAIQGLIIGCVDDSTEARKQIHESLQFNHWWLDAGNGHSSGQVLLGNAKNADKMFGAFDEGTETVNALPLPSVQLPSLLAPPTKTAKPRDCAEEVEANEQSPVINRAMAALVTQFVYRLLTGTLTWMGAYLDLDAGTLHTVPAEPVTVAKMLSTKVDLLMSKREQCSKGIFLSQHQRAPLPVL